MPGVFPAHRRVYGPAPAGPTTPGQSSVPDIFDEVNEDLRAERASRMARRYGPFAAVVLLLVLAGTGFFVWWQQRQTGQAEATAEKFIAAQKAADLPAPAKPGPATLRDFANVAANGPEGYRVLARLQLAALEWTQGNTAQALADWNDVAKDGNAPAELRDLATLASVQHRVDTGNAADLKAELQPLLQGDSAWKPMAEQVMAMLELKLGHVSAARSLIKALVADPQAPENIRQMAADELVSLGEEPPPAKPAGSKG
jgi:hypothetical protein